MIDTHTHILLEYYQDELNKVIEMANERLDLIINSSTDASNIEEVIKYSENNEKIYTTIGIHPTEEGNVELVEKYASHPKVLAIGEIGLDYYHQPVDKNYQKELFIKQMEIAKKNSKPVVIHSRNAFEDTYEILKKYPTVRGIIHCFSGSLEIAKLYKKIGYKVGIGGIITFKNAHLSEVVRELDLSDIVIETDAPYITPDPYRGKTNYPHYVEYIYQKVASVKSESFDNVVFQIKQNVSEIFDISL